MARLTFNVRRCSRISLNPSLILLPGPCRCMRRAGKKASEAMTAYPSIISEAKAAEQRAHEPSMEEILASIRRIISDDQALPLSSNPQATPRDERLPPLREPEMDRKRAPAAPRTSADFSGSFVSPPPSRWKPSDPKPRIGRVVIHATKEKLPVLRPPPPEIAV